MGHFDSTFRAIARDASIEARLEAIEAQLAEMIPCSCTACSNVRAERRRVAFVERRLALAALRGEDFDRAVAEISPGDLVQLGPQIATAECLADASPATRARLDRYVPWFERVKLSVADDHAAGRLAPLVEVRVDPSVIQVPGRKVKVSVQRASELREAGAPVEPMHSAGTVQEIVGWRYVRPHLSRDLPATMPRAAWLACLATDNDLAGLVASGKVTARDLTDEEIAKHTIRERMDKHHSQVLSQQMVDPATRLNALAK